MNEHRWIQNSTKQRGGMEMMNQDDELIIRIEFAKQGCDYEEWKLA